ncbi:phosphotransferase family protein [Desulfobotulus mexicanus]|uniref:Aminoglycoside phosphotransferase family protein n=1 Tax=Desulfobotulus mexicanus TaxID=2586642 RepID=A0A5Q4VDE0_9BACT|nr:aminoglycoside phosphotransferase family protein [Desulfobotulus mexicanus]TYT75709.1 aminoglycoside phosphotransferase family protein [Desulfobotulus mexicanus]
MNTQELPPLMDIHTIQTLAGHMGLGNCKPIPDICLAGSPERSQSRMAVETKKGIFVLERFSLNQGPRKNLIADLLFRLDALDLPHILLPLRDDKGRALIKKNAAFFQFTPYIKGEELPRPEYTKDSWRGKAFAGFIINLLKKGTMARINTPPFKILAYIRELMQILKLRETWLHDRILPISEQIEAHLGPLLESIPLTLSHGDLHPVNALFGRKELLYVIDWEFCGPKPDIHDTANLIGCLGSEDPMALQGPFVRDLLRNLRASGLVSPAGWQALASMVAAIRFCWLSEWLRKEDSEMIDLECDYLELLVSHRQALSDLWLSLPEK